MADAVPPDWVVFPDEEWEELGTEQAGFEEPELTNALTPFSPRPAAFWENHQPDEYAAVLTRAGYLVKKWGRTRDYLWQTASVGKAFTRAALGLAVYRLGLNPDKPVWHTWTGLGAFSHARKSLDNATHAAITWRHLADHTAGFGIENGFEWRWADPANLEPWQAANWTGDPVFDMISFRPPGQYSYSSANFIRLGQALTAFWGLDLKTVLDRELFSKIGIPADRWSWMSLREVYQNIRMYPEMPGYGHYADEPHEINGAVVRGGPGWVLMSAEDLARFALLVATSGVWKGKKLLSAEWLISKGGGNGSALFGDRTTFVAGSRVTVEYATLPDFMWANDGQEYVFPANLIHDTAIPGLGIPSGTSPKTHVLGIDDPGGALVEFRREGTSWQKTNVDAGANLSQLFAMFETGRPRVFGIDRDSLALYQAYWDGRRWRSGLLDPTARLSAIAAVMDPTDGVPQVYGIQADTRSLYQAYRQPTWVFRTLDAAANLSAIDAVMAAGFPQVFGIRAGTGALYQAYWNDGWVTRTLDPNAGLQKLSAVVDPGSGLPQVFGIKAGTGALYQAYYAGSWQFRILDPNANLSAVSAVDHSSPAVRRVFGIRANTKALYQAVDNGGWSFGDIDPAANLSAVSGVFDQIGGQPQVFGIRSSDKALYQASWNGTQWTPSIIDPAANFQSVDATSGMLQSYTWP